MNNFLSQYGAMLWPILFPFAVVAFWCFVVFIISLGGWHVLAGAFRATHKPQGAFRSLQRGCVGAAQYNGCLTIGVGEEGLYLAVLPIFAVGHPPLLIPWDKIGAGRPEKWFWFERMAFPVRAGKFQTIPITFDDRKVIEAVQGWQQFAAQRDAAARPFSQPSLR